MTLEMFLRFRNEPSKLLKEYPLVYRDFLDYTKNARKQIHRGEAFEIITYNHWLRRYCEREELENE
jgi:hypothetical protein